MLSKLYSASCVAMCYDGSLTFTLAFDVLAANNGKVRGYMENLVIRCILIIKC